MDFFIQMLSDHTEAFVTVIGCIVSVIFYLITKHAPSIRQSTIIDGLSQKAVDILLLIFKSTQYDHVKFNQTLKKPVQLSPVQLIPEQKMTVAVQAMAERLPSKTLQKAGDLFTFGQTVYTILKPLFKNKKK